MKKYERWSKQEDARLKDLYFKQRVPIREIIKILRRSPASVNERLTLKRIRNRSFRKVKIPTKITPTLARIHAHICGDGNLFKKKEKDSYGYMGCYKPNSHRYRYGIEYTNMNPLLIKEFMEDTKLIFNLKPYYYDHCVRVKSRDVRELLEELGAGKSHDWFISPKIMKTNREIKKNWIRAFFDDEACFNANGRIRVRSVNRKGLTQVMKMVREYVSCHITPINGTYPDGSVYLNINKIDINKYFSLIGSLRYKSG